MKPVRFEANGKKYVAHKGRQPMEKKRERNDRLRVAILLHEKNQGQIAWDLKINESRLSQITNGWAPPPNEGEKQKLADFFNKKVDELFNES